MNLFASTVMFNKPIFDLGRTPSGVPSKPIPVIWGVSVYKCHIMNVVLCQMPVITYNRGVCSPTIGLLGQEGRRADLVARPGHARDRSWSPREC